MGNIVLNAALLELAQRAAGCPPEEDFECTNKVYGQNPLALISNIAVITGLLSAFVMPFIGVILDFTSYRRFIGIVFSVVFTMIQIIQISIGPKTWFPMAILQSIGGFCFAGMLLSVYCSCYRCALMYILTILFSFQRHDHDITGLFTRNL